MKTIKSFGIIERAKRRRKIEGITKLALRGVNKVDIKARLYLAEKMVATPKLTFAAVEITNKCNLHCGMCEVERKRQLGLEVERFISVPFFKGIIDQLAELHAEVTLNYGGESLLHPNFKELLAYASDAQRKGLGKISWFDNATIFTKDLAQLVVNLGIDQVTFSVDRFGEANNIWRRGSDIKVIEKNIQTLMEIRGNRKKPYVLINKVDVDSPLETAKFVNYWTKIVDSVQVSTFRQPIWTVHEPDKYFGSKETSLSKYCRFPFFFMGILADGRVSGCGCDASAQNLMGNAFEDSLKKIWASERYEAFRRDTLNHVFAKNSPCAICDCWKRQFKPTVEDMGNGLECVYGESKIYHKL